MNDFLIQIEISNLNNVIETTEEISGVMEEGVFIPFNFNPVYRGSKGKIVLNLFAKEKAPNEYYQSHFIRMNFPKNKISKLERMGFNVWGICGNMRLTKDAILLQKNVYTNKKASIDDALSK